MKFYFKTALYRWLASDRFGRPGAFLGRSLDVFPGGRGVLPAFGAVLAALLPSAALGASVFLDSSAAGNQAVVNTSYGQSIYVAQPGANVNPAFKVDNMQANWSKDAMSGFKSSADMEPRPIHDLPVVTLSGRAYIALAVDFNETGASEDFGVINLMLWVGPDSAQSVEVATLSDPDIDSYAWSPSVKASQQATWQRNLRQMDANNAVAALGIDLVYQQNASPVLNVPGDERPYGSDPQRVFSTGLGTLGSNRADVAILIPFEVLQGRNSSEMLYLGIQTGSLADAGSDRVGFIDPSSIVPGGFLDQLEVPLTTDYTDPDYTIPVPEVSSSVLALLAGGLGLFRRRRAAA